MRVRWRVWALVVAGLLTALACTAVAARLCLRAHSRTWEVLMRQETVTAVTLAAVERDIVRAEGCRLNHGGGTNIVNKLGNPWWSIDAETWPDRSDRSRMFLNLKVESRSRGLAVSPITVTDRGAAWNRRAIDRLVWAFRQHRWPYRVVIASGAVTALSAGTAARAD